MLTSICPANRWYPGRKIQAVVLLGICTLLAPWAVAQEGIFADVSTLPAGLLPAIDQHQDSSTISADAYREGLGIFARVWTSEIAGVEDPFDGLGPLYSARSCLECHEGTAGSRALNDNSIAPRLALLFGEDKARWGQQLSDRSTLDRLPQLERLGGAWLDPLTGDPASQPNFEWRLALSLRMVPLIEAISDPDRLAQLDPADANGDGVRGYLFVDADDQLGRYGWQGQHPTLDQQIQHAFAADMGLEVPDEVTAHQVRSIADYLTFTAPPTLPTDPPSAFFEAGCQACHVPNGGLFSDLLLHDLGEGLLTQSSVDFSVLTLVRQGEYASLPAPHQLWRTAPLGDLQTAFEAEAFLHDARAQSFDQAVELHGGDAEQSRLRWQALSPAQRRDLAHFFGGQR